MSRLNRFAQLDDSFNPFETKDNSKSLRLNLNEIDNRDIRSKFKNTQDPINLAFQSIENTSLKTLAREFVKETIYDFVSCVKDFCK